MEKNNIKKVFFIAVLYFIQLTISPVLSAAVPNKSASFPEIQNNLLQDCSGIATYNFHSVFTRFVDMQVVLLILQFFSTLSYQICAYSKEEVEGS